MTKTARPCYLRPASVTIPDSVTEIGEEAFCGTAYYNDVTNWENGCLYIGKYLIKADETIENCTIKPGTLCICNSAFYHCSSLTSVTIPDSVAVIGECAFVRCSALTSVTISDSVTKIGRYAFENCSSLTSVTIPDSVTVIGKEVFSGCKGLITIKYSGSESDWASINIYQGNEDLLNANIIYNRI